VSGGVARAGAGDLLIMVSGSADAVHRVRPLLEAMASSAPVVGSQPGDYQKIKLVNQLLCGVHIAVAAEALAFAEAMQLGAAATWEVLRAGAAASFMLDDRGERMVHGADQVKSALDIFVKDMGLVLDAARENSYPAPSRRPPSSSTWPVAAPGSVAATTRPSSAYSAVGRPPDRCGPGGCPDLLHRPRLPAHRGSPLASTTQYGIADLPLALEHGHVPMLREQCGPPSAQPVRTRVNPSTSSSWSR
jgi:hypothetical protein